MTVLFCDVTGSTSMGERLDPESTRDVMTRYFEAVRRPIERHGGTVEKFIGDAVMAVFGVPAVHEDDALRAVRAAAEARDSVGRLSEELEPDGVTLRCRIGVNTGEVMAGDPNAGRTLVTGDTVNVAARLEQAATPGEVWIGEATLRLTRDAVRVEPVEPLALRGKSSDVGAFRLIDVDPSALGIARRMDSPLVDREVELDTLMGSIQRVVSERATHLCTLLGMPGVGKSRLAEGFLAAVRGARVLRGRCLPYGKGVTFFPVAQVLKQAAAIAEQDGPSEAEGKIRSCIVADEHADLLCARLVQVLGSPEGEAVPDETFWAFRRFLEILARERPLVIVFDDVQWGEPTFLDLIEHLVAWTRDAPILLLCIARPELQESRPAWGSAGFATSIVLEPLPDAECSRLIANLLGTDERTRQVRDRVAAAAEGNPLFAEQMVAMLIDDGVLVRQDQGWVAPTDVTDVTDVPMPSSVRSLLAARLDRLPAEERDVVQRASVVGRAFSLAAVIALSPEHVRRDVSARLMAAVRRELLEADPSASPGDVGFRFRHLLVRDAAYDSIPKKVRADLHERFAGWLAAAFGGRLGRQDEILAYHLEQAVRYRRELGRPDDRTHELARRASARLSNAARRATERGDASASAVLLSRAADLFSQRERERLELLPELAHSLLEAGRLNTASVVVREAVEAARQAHDGLIEARVSVADALVRIWTAPEGVADEATRVADRAFPVLDAGNDHVWLARAYRLRAAGPWFRSRYSEMAADAERAAEHARLANDVGEEQFALEMQIAALTYGPWPADDAVARCDEINRRIPGRYGEVRTGAILRAMLGGIDEAREIQAERHSLALELGWRPAVATALQELATLEIDAADWIAAERALREARKEFATMGEKNSLSTVLGGLAYVLCRQDRSEEAEPLIEESREIAASDDAASQTFWRRAMAIVSAERGDKSEARRLIEEAVAIGRTTDDLALLAEALVDLAQIESAEDRTQEAVDLLTEAIALCDEKRFVVGADRAREHLRALSLRAGGM